MAGRAITGLPYPLTARRIVEGVARALVGVADFAASVTMIVTDERRLDSSAARALTGAGRPHRASSAERVLIDLHRRLLLVERDISRRSGYGCEDDEGGERDSGEHVGPPGRQPR